MSDAPQRFSGLLEIDELAYLLASVSAERVVGFTDSTVDQADTTRGLQLLKDHDWLVQREDSWSLHPRLLLLAAILGTPERAMTITLHNPKNENGTPLVHGDLVFAYFEAQGTTVELSLSADGIAFIMEHDNFISLRLAQIGDLLAIEESSLPTLKVASDKLTPALKAAVPERKALIEQLLSDSLSDADVDTMSAALASETTVARVEGLGFLGRRPVVRKDLYCVGNPGVLVAGEQRPGTPIYISGFSSDRFIDYVDLVWRVLDIGEHSVPPATDGLEELLGKSQ